MSVIVHFFNNGLRFAHPFTCVVSGPTGSGKTEFVAKLIENISDMMVPVPKKILWCYGEWQKRFEKKPSRLQGTVPNVCL